MEEEAEWKRKRSGRGSGVEEEAEWKRKRSERRKGRDAQRMKKMDWIMLDSTGGLPGGTTSRLVLNESSNEQNGLPSRISFLWWGICVATHAPLVSDARFVSTWRWIRVSILSVMGDTRAMTVKKLRASLRLGGAARHVT